MSIIGRIIGRNKPCPCGSGKKYKKCCMENDESRRQVEAQAAAEFDPLAHKRMLDEIPAYLRM